MTDIIKTVGNRVRLYRQKAGMSQTELGELAGLHNTYIGQIERGEKSVSIEAIDKIIKALGLPYEIFFAKITHDNSETHETASECYDIIVRMDDKNQRLIREIIQNISIMME